MKTLSLLAAILLLGACGAAHLNVRPDQQVEHFISEGPPCQQAVYVDSEKVFSMSYAKACIVQLVEDDED